ncbi:MAG: LPS export ABC transporter periplasmic protein LptC [Methylococcaceae bacterium]
MIAKYQFYGLISVFALISWWMSQLTVSGEVEASAVLSQSPDYFSTGYEKIEMDIEGQLKSKVTADKLTHYGDTDVAELNSLVMTMYKPESPTWVIRSETGSVPAGGREVFLNGRVFIDRAKSPGYEEIKIITSNLRVEPEQDYAETEEWTDLIMPPDKTSGTGMKVTFSNPIHLELLANVRGRYE